MAGFLSVVYGSLFLFLLSVLKLWLLSRWLLPRLISFVVRRRVSRLSPIGASEPPRLLPSFARHPRLTSAFTPSPRLPRHHPPIATGASIGREGRGHHRRRRRLPACLLYTSDAADE